LRFTSAFLITGLFFPYLLSIPIIEGSGHPAATHLFGFFSDKLLIQLMYPENELKTRAAALRPSEYEY
jgi:hypothetical protein